MVWTETSPGLYQRPLGEAEKPMVAVISADRPKAREPVRIHCFAHFNCPGSSEKVVRAFEDAWRALRLLKSPDIATTCKDGFKHYKVPSTEEVQAW